MPFLGTVAERVFWEKIQSTETYINDTTLCSGFFPGFTDKGSSLPILMIIMVYELCLTPHLIRPAPLILTTGYDPQHVPSAPNDSAPWFFA